MDRLQSNQLVVDGILYRPRLYPHRRHDCQWPHHTGSNGAETAQLLIDTTIDRSEVAGGVTPPI